jgi:hypothetical protein
MVTDNVIAKIVPYLRQSASGLDRGIVERLAAIRRETIARSANGAQPHAAGRAPMNASALRGPVTR